MANLQARFAFPHLSQVLGELGVERSAAALISLRNRLDRRRPSDGTVRAIAYRYGLVRQEAMSELLSVLNAHLSDKGIRQIANENVIEFSTYIAGLGACLSYLESIRNADTAAGEGPIGAISAVSGYSAEVVESMRKHSLVPIGVSEAVLGAVRTVCGQFNYTQSTLKIQLVPAHLLDMRPIAVDGGRANIFDTIASQQI